MNLKVGQIIQYRNWQVGDLPVNDVDKSARGWGETGIIIRICDWMEKGVIYRQAGVEYLSSSGDIVLAHQKDLLVLNQPTRGSD